MHVVPTLCDAVKRYTLPRSQDGQKAMSGDAFCRERKRAAWTPNSRLRKTYNGRVVPGQEPKLGLWIDSVS